MRLNP